MVDFRRPIKYAADCSECPCCGQPWCDECADHYADCECPGPHSEPEDDEEHATDCMCTRCCV